MRRGTMSVCQLGRLTRAWPLLLLLMHLVERLSNDVVFRPLDGRTPHHVLWLRYRGKSGCCLGICARRVFAPSSKLLGSGGTVAVAHCDIRETGERGREDIVVCSCCLRALLLQRAHEALRILHRSMLEFFERFQIALALLPLYLQQ